MTKLNFFCKKDMPDKYKTIIIAFYTCKSGKCVVIMFWTISYTGNATI